MGHFGNVDYLKAIKAQEIQEKLLPVPKLLKEFR